MDITVPPVSRSRLLAFDGGGIRGLVRLGNRAADRDAAARGTWQAGPRAGRPFPLHERDQHRCDHRDFSLVGAAGRRGGPALSGKRQGDVHQGGLRAACTKTASPANRSRISCGTFFVEDDGSPATLGTSKLRTLLLVVTRNASTGSPWPMSNNPRAVLQRPHPARLQS